MKGVTVTLLLLLSVLAATLLHNYKINHQVQANYVEIEIELLQKGIAGIEKTIPPNTNIYYRQINAKVEIYVWTCYLLAPPIACFSANPCDTVLTVNTLPENDSINHSIIYNRKILWQNKDNNYHYILTCSN
jgi:hypothetical protein